MPIIEEHNRIWWFQSGTWEYTIVIETVFLCEVIVGERDKISIREFFQSLHVVDNMKHPCFGSSLEG
jgi:hypothetical protein